MYNLQGLSEPQLQLAAPSIFAPHASTKTSERYSFLPTIEVVRALADHGLRAVTARQCYSRLPDRPLFAKHLVRFQTGLQAHVVGDVIPEVVLTNSHDTGSAFVLDAGLFRLVCTNGMVVSAGLFGAVHVRHVGVSLGEVIEATYRVIENFPQITDRVRRWQGVQLTESQRADFAARAIGLRWEAEKIPFTPDRLLSTRRTEDQGHDLWRTFNVVQENLLQGQHFGRWERNRARRSGAGLDSTRAIKSIDVDLEINKGLWSLAEEFAGVVA